MLSCKIHVFTPPSGTFRPLQQVTGTIKYTIFEEMCLKNVVISLKGNGVLDAERMAKRKFKESYVNLEQVVHEDPKGLVLAAGTYKDHFSFGVPLHIPPSIETNQDTMTHKVSCSIRYYIRIKFNRGYLKSDKTFKKEIVVKPLLIPRLSLEPLKYQKFKVLKASSATCSYVFISATLENSVVNTGEHLKIHYTLKNGTNYAGFITRLLTSLVEVYKFKPNRPFVNAKSYINVDNATLSTGMITVQNIVENIIEIEVPRNVFSFKDSTLVTRKYFVKLILELPKPYSNIELRIPVVISDEETEVLPGNSDGAVVEEDIDDNPRSPPPSYWETMGEEIPEEDEEDAT